MAVFAQNACHRGFVAVIYTVTLNPALDKEYRVAKLAHDQVLRASSVKLDYGGKGFNIARLLATLGSDCIALGLIGGQTGDVLSEGLRAMGIKTDFVRVHGETRTNISIVGESDGTYIKVNEPGPEVSNIETDILLQKMDRLVQPGDWWILAGSLPVGMRADSYARMIRLINQAGARAVLDTSGEALKLGCYAQPFLIKPNYDELTQILDIEERDSIGFGKAIARLHEIGVKNIVLSAGKKATICSDGLKRWVGIPPEIEERNPIGAGDAMLAAVVYSLSENASMPDAFKWGIAAGSAAACLPGTTMPDRDQIAQLLDKVIISEE